MRLEQGKIVGGVWEAVLTGAVATPEIEAVTGGRIVEGVEVRPGPEGGHTVRVPIPGWALNDGVQTFVLRSGGETIASFALVAGEPLEQDIRAELSLLRAELDVLKRAFQRHVREG